MFRIARFTSSNLTWLQGKFWTIPRIQTWSEYSAVPILLVVHRWHDPDPHKHGKIPRLTPWYDLINVTQQHGGFILRLIKATLPEVTHNCLKAHRDGYYQHNGVTRSQWVKMSHNGCSGFTWFSSSLRINTIHRQWYGILRFIPGVPFTNMD